MIEFIDKEEALRAMGAAFGDMAEAADNVRNIPAADVRAVVNDCYKCPYKQLCHDLPINMSCEDVLNYARWRKADV